MKARFIRIAERSTVAANAALVAQTHEKAGFLAYHAFESAGSALGTHLGLNMGKTVSHNTKLKRFQLAAQKVGMAKPVALLTVRLASMRNKFLYPEILLDGTIVPPEDQITAPQALRLLKDVRFVVQTVRAKI